MENTERTYHFKKTLEKKERFVGGHRLCAGCGAGIAVRGVLRALREEDPRLEAPAHRALGREARLAFKRAGEVQGG